MNTFLDTKLNVLKICQCSDQVTLVYLRVKIEYGRDSSFPCLHPLSLDDTRNCTWLITWCHWKLQVSVVGYASSFFKVANQDPGNSRALSLLELFECGWGGVGSSLCLSLSITVVSSHLMPCRSFHSRSATADSSINPLYQASWCSSS